MSPDLEKLELLYRRLNFSISASLNQLTVEKDVAGIAVSHRFISLPTPDAESALGLATHLENTNADSSEIIVITGGHAPVPQEIRELFADISTGVFTYRAWLNRVIQSERVCRTVRERPQGSFFRNFVVPRLDPVPFSELEAWVCGRTTPAETLGNMVLLLGPSGFGKTTIAWHLAQRCADQHENDPNSPVPILISLEDFRAERRWDDLLAAYSRSMGMSEITPAALQFLLNHEVALLIVDGLDEMADRGGLDAASETLRQLMQITNNGRLLVTAREAYATHFDDVVAARESASPNSSSVSVVQVKGIDPEARHVLLSDEPEHVRRRTLEVIEQTGDEGTELSGNPLLIYLVAQAVSNQEDGQLNHISTTAKLLERVMDAAHAREQCRQGLEPQVVATYREFLGNLAVDAIKRGLASADNDDLIIPDAPELIGMWAQDVACNLPGPPMGAHLTNVLNRLAFSLRSHPMLAVTRGSNDLDQVAFKHPFFRDVLAAIYISDRIGENRFDVCSTRDTGPKVAEYVAALLGDSAISAAPIAEARCKDPVFGFLVRSRLRRIGRASCISHADVAESWNGAMLAGARIEGIEYSNVDFGTSDLSMTEFVGCRFINCRVASSALVHTKFVRCGATEQTLNELRSHGVSPLPARLEPGTNSSDAIVAMSEVDVFLREVLTAFFRRYVRGDRGRHQRSAKLSAFSRGLSQAKAEFTREVLLPTARRHGIVEFVENLDVLKFDPAYQTAADSLIFDGAIHDDIGSLYTELTGEALRYIA